MHHVDATDIFLTRLAGVTDPEQKRKIIGATFIDVFDEKAQALGDFDFLAQGTLYPDVIESVSVRGPSATIKSHHNVGGLPERMNFKLVEPLRELFKDEVRRVGRDLGIEKEFLVRQPFPGPGLAVRILGDITRDKLALLQKADAIVADEVRKAGLVRAHLAKLRRAAAGAERRRDGRCPHLRVHGRGARGREPRRHDRRLGPPAARPARLDLLAHRQRSPRHQPRRLRHQLEAPVDDRVGVDRDGMKDFVHLHLHTEFSLLDGACRIDELLDEAQRLKMPALAVTEHGNMFSSVVFHDAARKRGINPILGCEVYVAPGDRRDKSGTPGETANHLVLLAENEKGFKNLIKLVSSGYTEGFYYKPRIDKEILAQHAEGLIGLSSCLKGEVATGIRREQMPQALAAAAQYRDILGKGNFFLEMQFQGIEEQRIVNNGLIPIARDLEMPLVVTNDVHYLRHGDHKPHDILLCIGTGKSVNDENRLKYHGDQFFLKTAAQMAEVFGDYPDAMQNTLLIAERCNVTIPSGQNHLPKFAVPEGFTLDDYFEHVTRQGFAVRLERLRQLESEGKLRHTLAEYEERLAYEIAMIKKMEYPGTS